MLMGVMGHIGDYGEARSIVRQLMDALPSGSYLALADSINVGEAHKEAGRRYEEGGAVPYHLRSPEQIAGFFHGLTLVDPGVVSVSRWRPDPSPFGLPDEVESLAGVARKP